MVVNTCGKSVENNTDHVDKPCFQHVECMFQYKFNKIFNNLR